MIVIGVTGGVGTGKSTVSRMFGRLGAVVLDADRISHELLEPGTATHRRIRRLFGPKVVAPDGRIDRKRLGEEVFRSRRRLRELTDVLHPAVRRRVQEELRRVRRGDSGAVVVLDIPLLVESGRAYKTDAWVVVAAPAAVSARRLRARSGWSPREIRRRSSFQLPLRQKVKQADFVVNNGGILSSTRRQVSRIWKRIVKERKLHGGRKDG